MTGRSSLVLLLAVIVLAALAYFAFFSSPATAPDSTRDADVEAPATTTSPAEATNVEEKEASPAPRVEDDPARVSATTEEVVPIPAASRPRYEAPERVNMGKVRWADISGMDAVEIVMRETGLRLLATKEAREILEKATVKLDLEDKSAAYVLGMVLLPHSLGFTVREDRLMIFVETD